MITLNFLFGRLLISTTLNYSSGVFIFYLFSLFRTYFSVTSFCLIDCYFYYVLGSLVMFSNLGEMAFRRRHLCRHLRRSQQCTPLWSPEL